MENDVVGKLRAKVAAWRYGNPSRGLKVIAVAGASGKTTTVLLLSEILQEAGKTVITMTNHGCFHNGQLITKRYDNSPSGVQHVLSVAKKKNVDYVVVEVTNAFVETHALPTLMIEMSVVTNDSTSAQALLKQSVDYTVVPSGFDIAGLSVAPHQAISFGTEASAEAQTVRVKELRKGTEIEMVIDHQTKLQVATYLVGKANAMNVAAAVSAAYVLAADTSSFEEGIARLERVAANYEYLPKRDLSYDIVVDSACTESSVRSVLESAAGLKRRRLLVAIDPTVSNDLYPDVKRLGDRVVAVNDSLESPGIEKAESLQAAFDLLRRGAKKDDTILLLGREFAALDADGKTAAYKMIEDKGE